MKIFTMFLFYLSLVLVASLEEDILPTFNLKSGFYNGDSITLEISIQDPEAIIYYTLDGSDPTINSTIYTNFITLKDKSFEENIYSEITNVTADKNHGPKEKIKKANIVCAMAKLSSGTFTPIIS